MIRKINIRAVFSPEDVLCGLRNAEFRKRIICQIVGAECSANYTQWSNYEGAWPPEMLGGPLETPGLRGYKGASKRPP